MEQEIKVLKEENNKLLDSSKHWYYKYDGLLKQDNEDTPSYAKITPIKFIKLNLNNESILNL